MWHFCIINLIDPQLISNLNNKKYKGGELWIN